MKERDAVAAHPECAALAKWVVGLSIAQVEALRLAIRAGYEEAHGAKDAEMIQTICGLADGLEAALSGGEAKEKPRDIEAEIRDPEAQLAVVREKIHSYDGGDRPSSPPVALLREEQDLLKSIEAKEDERDALKPTSTVLPAGKPPPFLLVGMMLDNPQGGRWKVVGLGEDNTKAAVVHEKAGLGWADVAELLTWPLAEPFRVEEHHISAARERAERRGL